MFEQMQEFHFAQGDAREQRKRRNLSNSKKSTIPKENLVRHKEQLPDYHTHQASNRPLTNQRTRKAADSMNSQKSQEQHTSTKAYTSNQQKMVVGVLTLYLSMCQHQLFLIQKYLVFLTQN